MKEALLLSKVRGFLYMWITLAFKYSGISTSKIYRRFVMSAHSIRIRICIIMQGKKKHKNKVTCVTYVSLHVLHEFYISITALFVRFICSFHVLPVNLINNKIPTICMAAAFQILFLGALSNWDALGGNLNIELKEAI